MKKLSFKSMRTAVKLTYDNVKSGHWTKKNVGYYLWTEGIEGVLTKKCVDYAFNLKEMGQMY